MKTRFFKPNSKSYKREMLGMALRNTRRDVFRYCASDDFYIDRISGFVWAALWFDVISSAEYDALNKYIATWRVRNQHVREVLAA